MEKTHEKTPFVDHVLLENKGFPHFSLCSPRLFRATAAPPATAPAPAAATARGAAKGVGGPRRLAV